jgi:hypothetical protein
MKQNQDFFLYITWEDSYVQVTVDCSVGVYKFGNKGTRSIMCSYLEIYENSEKYVFNTTFVPNILYPDKYHAKMHVNIHVN